MMIALLLAQSALTLPPTGPDQIEYVIRATYEQAPAGQRCVLGADKIRAKVAELAAEVMPNGQPMIPPEHVKMWLASVTFGKPAPGEPSKTTLAVEYKTGTLIMVTAINWKWMPTNGMPGPDQARTLCAPVGGNTAP